jgi:hypothetical protein
VDLRRVIIAQHIQDFISKIRHSKKPNYYEGEQGYANKFILLVETFDQKPGDHG